MTAAAPKRRGRPKKPLPGAAAPLAPRKGRPPKPGALWEMTQRERLGIAMAHALHAVRAHLLVQPDRTPEVARHIRALEHAIDALSPPDGGRPRAPRRSASARNGDGR